MLKWEKTKWLVYTVWFVAFIYNFIYIPFFINGDNWESWNIDWENPNIIEETIDDKPWYVWLKDSPYDWDWEFYEVLKVSDWDTISILKDWKKVSIRFLWIDTPESLKTRFWEKECYWDQASDYLKSLLTWQEVQLQYSYWKEEYDKYNRLLAYIYFKWENINKKLVKEWYAYLYPRWVEWKNWAYFEEDWDKVSNNLIHEQFWEFYTARNNTIEQNIWLWNKCENPHKEYSSNELNNKNTNGFSCWIDKTCSKMDSCEEARFYLESCWQSSLDKDWNWTPCESICK